MCHFFQFASKGKLKNSYGKIFSYAKRAKMYNKALVI